MPQWAKQHQRKRNKTRKNCREKGGGAWAGDRFSVAAAAAVAAGLAAGQANLPTATGWAAAGAAGRRL